MTWTSTTFNCTQDLLSSSSARSNPVSSLHTSRPGGDHSHSHYHLHTYRTKAPLKMWLSTLRNGIHFPNLMSVTTQHGSSVNVGCYEKGLGRSQNSEDLTSGSCWYSRYAPQKTQTGHRSTLQHMAMKDLLL